LFTVGYEGATPESLVRSLRAAGVERVVDVRELPLSRRRGFSKTKLSETLRGAGIEYEHVRALGNPKANRERYDRGRVAEGARHYRVHLRNRAATALLDLSASIRTRPTCLLCVERSYTECHRSTLADAIRELDREVTIEHLSLGVRVAVRLT